ncbi:TetR/AcrR family transcriptional regulator [Streptomyces sp. NPDC057257]|uniref:TetR/AcrR family transcriptional regulator n=1 Tax=Streptomyces sp. NPDC057257 TaxID=3346071 RepID=UPI00363072AB
MTERRRQQDRTRATRQVLISTARRLFAQRGFAAVPAEEIVAEAGLTRGALRHHFGDKRELFRAVFEEQERDITDRVAAALADADGSWSAATKGLSAFLDACENPEVIRIALTDAPAVLGWADWRAIEARHGLGLVIAGLDQAMAEGILVRQPADVVGHLVLSAAIEAALLIAQAPDPRAARVEAEQALLALLGGLRTPSE